MLNVTLLLVSNTEIFIKKINLINEYWEILKTNIFWTFYVEIIRLRLIKLLVSDNFKALPIA